MLKRLRRIFAAPVFPDDEDKTRKAKYANVIAFAFIGAAIAFEIVIRGRGTYNDWTILDAGLGVIMLLCIVGIGLLRRGYVQPISMLLVVVIWIAANSLAANGFGAKDSSYLLNFAIVLMAGLLLGWRASAIVIALSIATGFGLAYAEQSGWIRVTSYPVMSFAIDISFVFGILGVLIYLLISGLESSLRRSRMNLAQLEAANLDLNRAQEDLENRSEELIQANNELEERTRNLQAIALVTRSAASIQDFESLLASITPGINKWLGYYQVALFLLDEQGEYLILRSANTDAGRRVMDRGHRVPVGQIAAITFAVQTGQPQVLQASNPTGLLPEEADLAESRSELILPLKTGDQVIGLLDLHSQEANAFTEADISTLTLLADQIAVTIQNLLLYDQAQNALESAGIASVQSTSAAWKKYRKTLATKGYRYDGIKSERLQASRQTGKGNHALSIPVRLRGQTIGLFKLNAADPARTWTDDEMLMVQATADRVALALEGARLLDEAQKRAAREKFLSEVATKLSASFQLDSILRDTVEELGQTFKNSTVTFQLVNLATPDNAPQTDSSQEQEN